jgi:hypothetical protein
MQPDFKPTVQASARLPRLIIVLGQFLLAGGGLTMVFGLLWLIGHSPRLSSLPVRGSVSTQGSSASNAIAGQPPLMHSPSRGWSSAAANTPIQTRTGGLRHTQMTSEEPPRFEITPHWDGFGAIEMSPSGPYLAGQIVTLSADAAPDWRFDHWSGAVEGSANPITLTISGATDVTATFRSIGEEDYFMVTTAAVGSGQVTVTPEGPYRPGAVALLTATPAANWRFVRWSGDIGSYDNPLTLTINDDFDVVALFALETSPPTITLATGNEGEGQVLVEPPGPYIVGQPVTLTAIAADGWDFDAWKGDINGATNPYTMSMTTNTTVIAHFEAVVVAPQPSLTIQTSGEGAVEISPPGPYTPGQTVALTAAASPNWRFVGWSGDQNSAANPLLFPILRTTSVTATFAPVESPEPPEVLEVMVNVVGAGQVEKSPAAAHFAGQRVVLTAQPSDTWRFVGWDGDIASQENPLTFILSQNVAVTATFAQMDNPAPSPMLTVNVVGPGQVDVAPPAPYVVGQQVTLGAHADVSACFHTWSGGVDNRDTQITVVLQADLFVTAEFGLCPLLLPLVTSP